MILLALACAPDVEKPGLADSGGPGVQSVAAGSDLDGDGWLVGDGDGWLQNDDCDDANASIHPEAPEHCDGVDEDCDSVADDDPVDATLWYADLDGDGYGDDGAEIIACDGPTSQGGDCDDADRSVHPGATDACPDGLDNDCDGTAASCPRSGEYDLTGALAQWDGETDEDRAGVSVAWAGEVNPPGTNPDSPCLGLVVGAWSAQAYAEYGGAAYLLCEAPAGERSLATATARLLGAAGARAGASVAGPGDLTGDGVPDIVVGAPDAPGNGLEDAGATYVVAGPAYGDVLLEDAAFIVRGEVSNGAGGSVASGGDNDGDGAIDVLSAGSSAEHPDGRGAVTLWRGPLDGDRTAGEADATLLGESPDDWAGPCAATDLDGDGLDDIGVVAQGDDSAGDRYGAAYVTLGPVQGVISLADADWKLVGAYFGGASEMMVVPGGDLDRDGRGELLVGEEAPGPTPGESADEYDGAVYEVSGPVGAYDELEETATVFRGPVSTFNAYASRPANAGDMNGDGWDDVAIGGPVWTSRSTAEGAVFVVYGPSTGTVDLGASDLTWLGTEEWGGAGVSVAGAGDADGDGCADLLIGGVMYFDYQGHAWLAGGCST